MTTKAKRSRGMPRRTPQRAVEQRRSRWMLIGGGLVAVAVLAIVAVLLALGPGGVAEPATEPLVISGTPLAELPVDGPDPAVGATLPSLTGTDMAGQPLQIGPAGSAQMIVVLAHWCAHCQAELPGLVDLIDAGDVPDGVSVVGLSTSINELRPNYPPSDWFDSVGWQQPTLIDDANSGGLAALGMSRFPGFVFVDSQGRVTQRMTGEVDRQTLIQAMEVAAAA